MNLSRDERLERNALIRAFKAKMSEASEQEASHASRVAVYSVATGQEMGFSADDLLTLRYAAELHDFGKIGFPLPLRSGRKAVSEDWAVIRSHPSQGVERLQSISWLTDALHMIQAHHEHWDGSGYPSGLASEAIPLGARIIAVAEAFDAMTMASVWRETIPEEEAVEELRRCTGTQFNPEVVDVFLRIQLIVQPVGL